MPSLLSCCRHDTRLSVTAPCVSDMQWASTLLVTCCRMLPSASCLASGMSFWVTWDDVVKAKHDIVSGDGLQQQALHKTS